MLKLHTEQELSLTRKYLFAVIALSIAVVLVYSNSLTVEWHYDDRANILENLNVRLTDISRENIQKTFYNEGRILRPLAYFSFAINYYFGKYNVFGYHLVNLLVHLSATLFLFVFIFKTLNLQTIKNEYGDRAYSIAILGAFIWAIHPIQVHAVTTIVQRMASLCGMFYILTMLLYLKGRLSGNKGISMCFYLAAVCTGIMALGTKENAIMLPVSLFFYDLILIQGLANIKNLRQIIVFCAIILALLITVSIFFIDFSSIPNSYGHRPFMLKERLLTEPRIIIFYISLLLYPISSRMTLLHDPAISHTLLDPWTTLPSIIMIIGGVLFALRYSFKKPLWSFCIIFFLLNHIVEGTFIPLELIYEHRNYIPSMFFFIPVSIVIIQFINYFSYKHYLNYFFVFAFSALLVMLGHTVYERNHTMRTELSLWLDNVKKYPNLSRVHNNIGEYYWNKGFLGKACFYFNTAYQLNHEMNSTQYGVVACNLGNCFFNVARQYDKARLFYEEALRLYPGDPSSYSGMGLVYLKKGDISRAKQYILAALKSEPDHPEFLHNLALIHFFEKNIDRCIEIAQKALSINKKDVPALMLLGQSYTIKREYSESIKYWTEIDSLRPNGVLAKLALIELYALINDTTRQTVYVNKLKNMIPRKSIDEIMVTAENENPTFTIFIPNHPLLKEILESKL